MAGLNPITIFNKRIFLYFFFIFNFYYPVNSQQVNFNRVTVPGISNFGLINKITQDSTGYMWFAVYDVGLRRYDGYHVTTYQNDPQNPQSLVSNEVITICAARDGVIWTGTQDSGLDRLDPATNIFTHYRHDINNTESLCDDRVTAILEDHEGMLWIGTMNGLDRLDPGTQTFVHYKQIANDTTSLSNDQVQVLYEDRRGTLWVGTGRKANWNDITVPKIGGLNRFDRKTSRFTRFMHDPNDPSSLTDNKIGAIFEDSKGTFWVTTAGNGLHTMNRDRGIFKRYVYNPAHPEKLGVPPPKQKVIPDLHIFFISEDGVGSVWFGLSGGWLTKYDPKTGKAMHYESLNGDMQAMRAVSAAFTSKEGVLWIATWLGNIYRVDPFKGNFSHSNMGSIVSVIHEDASGVLWVGTLQEGLIRVDRKTGNIKRFFADPSGLSNETDLFINAIYQEDDSTLWIGSQDALYHYNIRTQIFTRYNNDPNNQTSLSKGIVEYIIADQPGSLWIATQAGLDHFDIKTGIFRHFRHNEKDTNTLSDNIIMCLLKDHSGNLWIGTFPGIVNLFNPVTRKFRHYQFSGSIGNIVEDSENNIWVGTSKGLYRSNSGRNSFSLFTDPRMPINNATDISAILEDNQKNLWVSSSEGIFRINLGRDEISVYNKNQGVDAANFSSFSMLSKKVKGGEFFFGDGSGYYTFFPDQFKSNSTPPQIVISAFRLADEVAKPGKGSPLSVPITLTREIHLSHNQNTFSFDFAGMHYASPEDNQHLYMLENLDNNWRKAGVEKTAYYYNVPPGRYIFRVKVANSDGVWAEKAITVIVHPPWWSTWWAYSLYSLVFFIALWGFIKWRERTLKKEKTFLEKTVTERTLELRNEKEKVESTLSELKAMQAQLIQSEQLASLNKIEQAMLHERLRISRELHDDIGSTLSGIVLYSHMAENQVNANHPDDVEQSLNKIQQSANDMVARLNDLVWAVNPLHSSVKDLVQKLQEYAIEMATIRNIKVRVGVSESMANIVLPLESLHNIYLLCKESINNAVKYSKASILELSVRNFDGTIEFKIVDNGEGFNMATAKKGNGLINMQKRADEAGAILSVKSSPGKGTVISLQCKITC